MNINQKKWLIMCVVTTIFLSNSSYSNVRGNPEVPCFFIFGDSLVDNGNNNGIASIAKANYLPYGIDFPKGPTGRFSNGKTVADTIAQLLGFDDYIQPYSNVRGSEILRGVNYASAAAGIRDESGQQLVIHYVTTVSRIVGILGTVDSAANHLKRCIFFVAMGSNDYLNNYFMPNYYKTSRRYTPKQYANVLIQLYENQIRVLHNYGARKFVFNGIGPIECSPAERTQQRQNGSTCAANINTANQMFNQRLVSLVDSLNKNLPDSKSIYINNYDIFQDLLNHPKKFGFKVTNRACCGMGRNNSEATCQPFQIPCKNRNKYIFWDSVHPTEAACKIVGWRSYSAASSSDVYPIDIRHLAQL